MKTKTTIREFDADGRMVKETVTEYDSGPVATAYCSCNSFAGGYCPLHGYVQRHWPTITTTTTTPRITVTSGGQTVTTPPRNPGLPTGWAAVRARREAQKA